MADQPALFDLGNGASSEEEKEVAAFIDGLAKIAPLTAVQRVVARMCLALAKSIAEGNRKGRSVANDVERLMATMRELDGTAADAPDELTPAERELLNALATAPRLDPAPPSNPA
jgi:hypothetical protein